MLKHFKRQCACHTDQGRVDCHFATPPPAPLVVSFPPASTSSPHHRHHAHPAVMPAHSPAVMPDIVHRASRLLWPWLLRRTDGWGWMPRWDILSLAHLGGAGMTEGRRREGRVTPAVMPDILHRASILVLETHGWISHKRCAECRPPSVMPDIVHRASIFCGLVCSGARMAGDGFRERMASRSCTSVTRNDGRVAGRWSSSPAVIPGILSGCHSRH